MDRKELLKRVGSVEQIGGIKDYTLNDGKAKGVRVIEVNTGVIRFCILPDRCMDIAQAYYKENAVSWFSKTGIVSPHYYEKDEKSWLRSFYGGLITTCGLKNIGGPYKDQGLHGRIANLPAQKVSVYADWEGDEYVMRISGEMRESVVFGENLVLKRTITAKLFADEFSVEDTIVNEGFSDEKAAICYHCNFGYPLVREGAKMVNIPIPQEVAKITAPIHEKVEECYVVDLEDEVATVGIENGEIGAYITYNTKEAPGFFIWKMLGESEYVVGLEPRSTALGGEDIDKANEYIILESMGEHKINLKFSFKTL